MWKVPEEAVLESRAEGAILGRKEGSKALCILGITRIKVQEHITTPPPPHPALWLCSLPGTPSLSLPPSPVRETHKTAILPQVPQSLSQPPFSTIGFLLQE